MSIPDRSFCPKEMCPTDEKVERMDSAEAAAKEVTAFALIVEWTTTVPEV